MGIQHLVDAGGQQVTAVLEKFLFVALSLSKTKKRNKDEEKGHDLTRTRRSPHSPAMPAGGFSRAVPLQCLPCWGSGRCEGRGSRAGVQVLGLGRLQVLG